MPKNGKDKSTLVKLWINKKPEFKIISENAVFCVICDKRIPCKMKFQLDQHVGTAVHKKKLLESNSTPQQQILNNFLTTNKNPTKQDLFSKDLSNLFLSCDIPINKLEHDVFKNFLKTHCYPNDPEVFVHSSSTIRKKYVDVNFQEILENIRKGIRGKYLWISVDETTDSMGRYIANLIVGVLDSKTPTKAHLVAVQELARTNSVSISRFVNDSLIELFLPERLPTENILLLLTDAAPYMMKAGQNLQLFYPNLIHCSCLAHGLNRVAEMVRLQFPLVNKLVCNIKKVFLKEPLRVQKYREMLPNTPLPPETVLTRWGTWLKAAIFLSNHFGAIKKVICSFDSPDCKSIGKCQAALAEKTVESELAFIKANYGILSETIIKLEDPSLSLPDAINLMNQVETKITAVQGEAGRKIKEKLVTVLAKNEGFSKLKKMYSILLEGDFSKHEDLDIRIPCNLYESFNYAPITSCDVERSFSIYKHLLTDKRQNLTPENINKYMIIRCNLQNNFV